MNILAQLRDLFEQIVDEITVYILALFGADTPEIRLRRLRHVYYDDPKATITYRRAREVLQKSVHTDYHSYYERILTTERATHRMVKNMHSGARGNELMEQMQRLGEKAVHLLDQVQNADEILNLYQSESANAQQVSESRAWLLARVDDVLEIQASIPARVMSFQQVTSGRGIDKLSERIARLTTRLDDIADSYADIDRQRYENLAQIIEDEAHN